MKDQVVINNCGSVPLDSLALLPYEKFAAAVQALLAKDARVAAYFATPPEDGPEHEIFAVLGQNETQELTVLRGKLPRSFQSLTPQCPQLHLFEREIAEQYGLVPEGHPWLKPARFHAVWEGSEDAWQRDPKRHPVPVRWIFSGLRVMRSMKLPSDRCMLVLLNRAISVFSVLANRSSAWRFLWASSIAGLNNF